MVASLCRFKLKEKNILHKLIVGKSGQQWPQIYERENREVAHWIDHFLLFGKDKKLSDSLRNIPLSFDERNDF